VAAHERLFIALWPDAVVRSKIVQTIADLELSGRIAVAGNLHVTLVFLGACDRERRGCVERAASSVVAPAFEISLTQMQWRRRGGIVWLAAPHVPAPLAQLMASLNAALESCGHTAEPRAFRPHVTVARDVRRFARARTITAIVWRVSDYCLVSSTLGPQGSRYSVERRWALAGSEPA
jgi:RNA 2',3'-cyclic 3'-phosphodiesterase